MQTVKGRKENASVVHLDDTYFVDCEFSACFVHYAGGDFGWENTRFKGCRLFLLGPAGRTLSLLRYFDLLTGGKDLGVLSSKAEGDHTKEWVQ